MAPFLFANDLCYCLYMVKTFLFHFPLIFCLALPLEAQEAQWKTECETEYKKMKPTPKMGVVRYSSQERKDEQECSGKVGASFCLDDKVRDYMTECLATKEKEKAEKIKELRESLQQIKEEDQAEKLQRQKQKEDENNLLEAPDEPDTE